MLLGTDRQYYFRIDEIDIVEIRDDVVADAVGSMPGIGGLAAGISSFVQDLLSCIFDLFECYGSVVTYSVTFVPDVPRNLAQDERKYEPCNLPGLHDTWISCGATDNSVTHHIESLAAKVYESTTAHLQVITNYFSFFPCISRVLASFSQFLILLVRSKRACILLRNNILNGFTFISISWGGGAERQ